MKKTIFTILPLLFTTLIYSQDSIMPLLHQKFPAYELKSDLVFIKNKAVYKNYNYDGLIYAGKKNFYHLYDSIEKVIDDKGEMSRLEFYFLTAPLVNILQDDHSYYTLMGDFTKDPITKRTKPFAEKFVIPFTIYLFNDSVFIVTDTTNRNKSQLLSINGVSTKSIISELTESFSYSRFRYINTNQYGGADLYYFPILTSALFGFENTINIKYTPSTSDSTFNEEMELFQIEDSTFYNYQRSRRDTISWYTLSFNKNIAILRIKSIPYSNSIAFFNKVFKEINENQAESLVLDISSCSHSNDLFWHVFLDYLYEGDLWLYEYHDEKRYLSKYIKKKLKNSKFILGKYSEINNENRFHGDFYLITGPATSGAAVRFADRLRFNNIVKKIYGRETLSKSSQFDFPKTYYLPNTGLRLRLSITFFSALDKNRDTHGLIPDIIVKPSTTAEFLDNKGNRLVIDKVSKLIIKERAQE